MKNLNLKEYFIEDKSYIKFSVSDQLISKMNIFFLFSCRVLKPPGGPTSDIFGGSLPSTPRSVRNNMASNIFAPANDAKNGNGNGMHSKKMHLFIV